MQDSIPSLPEGWREKVARIIETRAFTFPDRPELEAIRQMALAKADAILSALSAAPLPVGGGEERDSGSDSAPAKAPVSEGRPTPLEEAVARIEALLDCGVNDPTDDQFGDDLRTILAALR